MAAYKLTDIQKKHLQEILSDPFFAREQEESQKSTDPHGREAKTQINKNVTQKLREAETNFSPQAARELREAPGALEILRSRLALKKVQNNPVFPAQSVKSSLPFAQPSQSDSGEWNSAREQALEMNAEATLNLANRALRDSGLSSYAQKQKGYELNDLFEQAKDPLHYQEGIDGMNAFIDSVYPMEPQKRNLVMQGESGSTRTMERDYRDGLDDESIYLPSRRIDTDRADDLAQSFGRTDDMAQEAASSVKAHAIIPEKAETAPQQNTTEGTHDTNLIRPDMPTKESLDIKLDGICKAIDASKLPESDKSQLKARFTELYSDALLKDTDEAIGEFVVTANVTEDNLRYYTPPVPDPYDIGSMEFTPESLKKADSTYFNEFRREAQKAIYKSNYSESDKQKLLVELENALPNALTDQGYKQLLPFFNMIVKNNQGHNENQDNSKVINTGELAPEKAAVTINEEWRDAWNEIDQADIPEWKKEELKVDLTHRRNTGLKQTNTHGTLDALEKEFDDIVSPAQKPSPQLKAEAENELISWLKNTNFTKEWLKNDLKYNQGKGRNKIRNAAFTYIMNNPNISDKEDQSKNLEYLMQNIDPRDYQAIYYVEYLQDFIKNGETNLDVPTMIIPEDDLDDALATYKDLDIRTKVFNPLSLISSFVSKRLKMPDFTGLMANEQTRLKKRAAETVIKLMEQKYGTIPDNFMISDIKKYDKDTWDYFSVDGFVDFLDETITKALDPSYYDSPTYKQLNESIATQKEQDAAMEPWLQLAAIAGAIPLNYVPDIEKIRDLAVLGFDVSTENDYEESLDRKIKMYQDYVLQNMR